MFIFETLIIYIAKFSIVGSIGSQPYFVPWLKGKILLRSVGLAEDDLKHTDSEKFSEIEKKANYKLHREVQQRLQKDWRTLRRRLD